MQRKAEEISRQRKLAYLFVCITQLVLQNGFAINQRLDFIRERDEGLGQSLDEVNAAHVTWASKAGAFELDWPTINNCSSKLQCVEEAGSSTGKQPDAGFCSNTAPGPTWPQASSLAGSGQFAGANGSPARSGGRGTRNQPHLEPLRPVSPRSHGLPAWEGVMSECLFLFPIVCSDFTVRLSMHLLAC